MKKENQILLSVIGVAILIIIIVGVSFAFFNYTRTGAINNIGTGRIYFYTNQSDTLNITNLFPIATSEVESANLDSVTINIVGDTTYADGEEFEIKIVDVNNTINGKKIPVNYIATYTKTATESSIGTSNNNYWEDRNNKDASIYLLNAAGKVKENKQVLVGYIDNDNGGINGTLTIKAYIDADRIAITDTEEENIDWQQERTIFTTNEWNSFQNSPISFKIRAESNEGIWVEKEVSRIDSCPGCKYLFYVTVI